MIGSSEREEKVYRTEKIFEEMVAKNVTNMVKCIISKR